jgi:hypothetical protein
MYLIITQAENCCNHCPPLLRVAHENILGAFCYAGSRFLLEGHKFINLWFYKKVCVTNTCFTTFVVGRAWQLICQVSPWLFYGLISHDYFL